MRTLYLVLESILDYADNSNYALENNSSGVFTHIKNVRGDCGYQVANIVVSTPTEFADIDAYELARKEFRVPSDTFVCISIYFQCLES